MVMEERQLTKTLYKLELYCIKIIPFIISLCYVLNTISSYIYKELPILSYIGGMSLLPLLFIYLSSFVFKFCITHRLPLYYIFISDCMSYYDMYIGIPISTKNFFVINLLIFGVFVLLLGYLKFRKNERTISKKNR